MIKDIISAYSIIGDLKEIMKKAKIRSSQKLLDLRYSFTRISVLNTLYHNELNASVNIQKS